MKKLANQDLSRPSAAGQTARPEQSNVEILSAATSPSAQAPADSLCDWIERQNQLSASAMLRCISATDIIKDRRAFGQVIRPAKGSVLASPVPASYDPDPDYFFHWLRDSAMIMDALRALILSGAAPREAIGHFKDFLAFSLSLVDLDGEAFLKGAGDFRRKVEPFFLQYVRSDDDLSGVRGSRVLGEPRFNPDGTLDILKWSRPQHDGPALRAVAVLRFWPLMARDEEARRLIGRLVVRDVTFTFEHWREPSFDIWEEELGSHYYTRLAQHAALAEGARWADDIGEPGRAAAWRAGAREIADRLDDYWDPGRRFYLSRLGAEGEAKDKELDIAVLLAVLHAGRADGRHSILDPRLWVTVARLEDLFAEAYAINRSLADDRAPAMGRYAGDKYYSGGAYFFSTLGAAEFHYRLAGAAASGAAMAEAPETMAFFDRMGVADLSPSPALVRALLRRGDQFMATARAYTPADGDLSEQFDQTTGAQTSAKNLAWSHAAFITAAASRAAATAAAS